MTLTLRQQIIIACLLLFVLVLTRGQHAANIDQLPGATGAAFLLAGVYITATWFAVLLFAATWLIDFLAVSVGGVDSFCISPAYGFLIPAYGALWLAGRYYATRYQFHYRTLLPLSVSVFGGAVICELLSSGSFYWFSGHFSQPTVAEFGERLVTYFPTSLSSLLFYVAIAILVHITLTLSRKAATQRVTNPKVS